MPKQLPIILITILGFILRAYVAFMDKFLHPWDERFHALVARNLMHSPFKPLLRAYPVTDNYDPNMWCCNHIWLHKQPLFMWQMAISMKVFGVSEFTMRLPSVIMGTLAILLLYRIVILATGNKTIALWAAFLLAISSFHLKMIAGIQGMDHNDVALGFYVLVSFWAYGEYMRKPHWFWVVLIGLCCGAAILCKWLLGLLVYSAWSCNLLYNYKRIQFVKEWRALIVSLIVCVIVFVPWQLYIMHYFPEQAYYEYEFNRRHITEALEGHEGSYWYYMGNLPHLLGMFAAMLPFLGFYLQYRKRLIQKQWVITTIVPIVVVFCFFNFIVKTKVDTYLFFIVPLVLVYSAMALYYITQLIRNKFLQSFLVIALLLMVLNPVYFIQYLSKDNTERNARIYNAEVYRNIKQYFPGNVKVVMNMNSFEDIDVMFYNNELTAYHWTLPEVDIESLKLRQMPIAVFSARGNYNIPKEISSYPYLYIIPVVLKDPEAK